MTKRTVPGLGLTAFWGASSNGWDGDMDDDLRKLSILSCMRFKGFVAALPTDPAPTVGDAYIVNAGTDVNKVCVFDTDGWVKYTPTAGTWGYSTDADSFFYYKASATAWKSIGGFFGRAFTSGTAEPSGGSDGDVYFQTDS